MQARVIRTRASVGSAREASGTSSMRTSPAENMTVARIGQATSFEVVEGVTAFTKARSGRAELLGSWAATVDENRPKAPGSRPGARSSLPPPHPGGGRGSRSGVRRSRSPAFPGLQAALRTRVRPPQPGPRLRAVAGPPKRRQPSRGTSGPRPWAVTAPPLDLGRRGVVTNDRVLAGFKPRRQVLGQRVQDSYSRLVSRWRGREHLRKFLDPCLVPTTLEAFELDRQC